MWPFRKAKTQHALTHPDVLKMRQLIATAKTPGDLPPWSLVYQHATLEEGFAALGIIYEHVRTNYK